MPSEPSLSTGSSLRLMNASRVSWSWSWSLSGQETPSGSGQTRQPAYRIEVAAGDLDGAGR